MQVVDNFPQRKLYLGMGIPASTEAREKNIYLLKCKYTLTFKPDKCSKLKDMFKKMKVNECDTLVIHSYSFYL